VNLDKVYRHAAATSPVQGHHLPSPHCPRPATKAHLTFIIHHSSFYILSNGASGTAAARSTPKDPAEVSTWTLKNAERYWNPY
jgi:hypothetical protein